PFDFYAGAQAMTLATQELAKPTVEAGLPVLLTERLTLRAPCRADVKAITHLAADRRIAANTTRVPHPYRASDAEQFIAAINRRQGEAVFVITVDSEPIGL